MRMKQPAYTRPIPTVKSVRPDNWRGLTSMKPGVITPLAFFPLLREDRIRGSLVVQVKSEETLHVVINPVRVRVGAYLIPKTALSRFGGSMEALNRSYMDEPADPGFGTTPKWFLEDMNPGTKADSGYPLFDVLGIHYQTGMKFNSDLCESYNLLVNWMRQQVSPALPQVALDNADLAAAFWDNWRFQHIKPSFDAAQMEAAVPVSLDAGNLRVGGYTYGGGDIPPDDYTHVAPATGDVPAWASMKNLAIQQLQDNPGLYAVATDMQGMISLANIAAAKQTQAFAAMRDRYKTVPDEYLVDLLMRGISIPDADLAQPLYLGGGDAVIGQTERYATDGDNLDVSVANGVAQISMTINTPPINSGGIVLVVASVVPEQLFERVTDVSMAFGQGQKGDVRTPDYLSDYLDPQKVEIVTNAFADCFHSDPAGIFGYAPLNYAWRRNRSQIGGRFKRPVPDAFKEDRQRIWSVEIDDPALSADWYLCPQPFPQTVFADTASDPYEVITIGTMQVVGPTVFGAAFGENMSSYDEVIAQVDMDRLKGDAAVDGNQAVVAEAEAEVSKEGEVKQ